jgi:hypothetical protein
MISSLDSVRPLSLSFIAFPLLPFSFAGYTGGSGQPTTGSIYWGYAGGSIIVGGTLLSYCGLQMRF